VRMSRRSFPAGVVAAPALGLWPAAREVSCSPGDFPRLRIMVPASPGGGWDTTACVLQRVIQTSGLARNDQVFNIEAPAGSSASARYAAPSAAGTSPTS